MASAPGNQCRVITSQLSKLHCVPASPDSLFILLAAGNWPPTQGLFGTGFSADLDRSPGRFKAQAAGSPEAGNAPTCERTYLV